jgi:uncharacterized protein YjbJ (UPF0337 family)
LFASGARDENIVTAGQHCSDNSGDMFRGLSGAKDHFGKALSDRPMMINVGKTEILEGKVSQQLERVIISQGSASDIRQDLPQLFFGHSEGNCT